MRFEIRIPTFERPVLLGRALGSLLAQTHEDWRAVIFDDSGSAQPAELVRQLGDKRIEYIRNGSRLGAAANIDQCLSPRSIHGGNYGCLLEDDNFWLPNFLSMVKSHLSSASWDLLLANQRINVEGEGLRAEGVTTRGTWFPPGPVEPLQLRATLLLMEGLSNGGLVWRLAGTLDLRVGTQVKQTTLHEACRSLLVSRPFLFVDEAQAVWTSLPAQQSARANETRRIFGRGMQSIRSFILRRHGEILFDQVSAKMQDALAWRQLAKNVAYAGHISLAARRCPLLSAELAKSFAKGMIVRASVHDPCGDFLKSGRAASLQ